MYKQNLINKLYDLCNKLIDIPVQKYNQSERDLWNSLVDDALNNVSASFTPLVSGTSMSEIDYMQLVLDKNSILDKYRKKCINARNRHKEDIMKCTTIGELVACKKKLRTEYWPSPPPEAPYIIQE